MTSPVLQATGLGKRFLVPDANRIRSVKQLFSARSFRRAPKTKFWALRDVDMDVRPGQMVGVVGRNGAGKSTLLRLLGGVMPPDAGAVTREGKVSGLLALNGGMHTDLTGRENIIINGVVAGLTRSEVRARFDDIVAFAELEAFIDQPVRTYSSGMQMRLGFAVAVHVRPQILLIDEVLSVGDIAFQRKCIERILQFKADGAAMVLISHDLDQVEALCDTVIWLREGQIAAQGEPALVLGEYRTQMMAVTHRLAPDGVTPMLTSSGAVLTMHENRFGSLEAEVRDLRISGGLHESAGTCATGEAVTLCIVVEAKHPVQNANLSVTICTAEGLECVDVNTEADGAPLPPLNGRHEIHLCFDRLDLAPGEYLVSVGLFEPSWRYAYDYQWRAHPLTVRGRPQQKGVVAPPRTWRVL